LDEGGDGDRGGGDLDLKWKKGGSVNLEGGGNLRICGGGEGDGCGGDLK
jgi:hypothetical protein